MRKKLLFLTLNTFSATGGIETVCRVAGKALHETTRERGGTFRLLAMHDGGNTVNEAYVPASAYRGFGGKQIKFTLAALREGQGAEMVLLSHINLLPIGFLIKTFSPKTKLVLIAHGIEVWEPLQGVKASMLKAVDLFLPVSRFTGDKLQAVQNIAPQKIKVLNNCLDPFLKAEVDPALVAALRKRYGFSESDFILLTVTRLKFSEQYKGYDKVVQALQRLKPSHPDLKYLIVGKWDEAEKKRLDAVIAGAHLQDAVIFAGFAKEEELSAHFKLADAYIMPSTGEGFGIVFIEALFYGLPVIAGNVDGSVDALAGGEFGLLVNPANTEEISEAILRVYSNKEDALPLHQYVTERFGFETYKSNLQSALKLSVTKPREAAI